MTCLVFGHKSPDTDSTGSPIIWAWYLNEIKGADAKPVLLGEPNTEALFMLTRWALDKPDIVSDVADGQACVVVDTNNNSPIDADRFSWRGLAMAIRGLRVKDLNELPLI